MNNQFNTRITELIRELPNSANKQFDLSQIEIKLHEIGIDCYKSVQTYQYIFSKTLVYVEGIEMEFSKFR
jgi:hypothetical protein